MSARRQLLRDPRVLFSGYKVPHPLETHVLLRVQTTPDYTPEGALQNALSDCMTEVQLLLDRFRAEAERVGGQQGEGAGQDGYM